MISDVERYKYLIYCFSDPPLIVVKVIPLSMDNYSIAWNELKIFSENRQLLATAHIDKLFAYTPFKKEFVTSLS